MTRTIIVNLIAVLLLFSSSCTPRSSSDNNVIATDPAAISAGEKMFNTNCSGCHNFRQDGIGPQLSGITATLPVDWMRRFIRDPGLMLSSGDDHAQQLHKNYKATMPAFPGLKDSDINNVIAYIASHKKIVQQPEDKNALSNPIPDPIKLSGLTVGLKLVTQFPPSIDSGKTPSARITSMAIQPLTNDLFVLDLRGKLYRLQNSRPVVYMDMSKLKSDFINEPGLATGFGSFAFHPDFFKNGLLYTTHSEAAGSGKADFSYPDSIKVALQWVLTEWRVSDLKAQTFSGTGRELMRINMVSGIHGVQQIAFDPLARKGDSDYGLLYISVGDGGAVENGYQFLTHNKEKVWGTILRIDPFGNTSSNGQYGIPQNNPFVHDQDKNVLGEIYAYGFRNPHRFTWTRSGKMIACNIGQANIESIDVVKPGNDYGWPIREGNFLLNPYGNISKVYPLPLNDSIYKVTYPVAEYDHDEGKAISGGFEYSGTAISTLKGKFLFGDIPTGRLFFIDLSDVKPGKVAVVKEWQIEIDGKTKTFKDLCRTGRVDIHFGKDSRGELYILTKADGKLYKLVSAKLKTVN